MPYRPLPKHLKPMAARLMHIHWMTHPKRLAQRLGVSLSYITHVYGITPEEDMAKVVEVLEYLDGKTQLRRPQGDAEERVRVTLEA